MVMFLNWIDSLIIHKCEDSIFLYKICYFSKKSPNLQARENRFGNRKSLLDYMEEIFPFKCIGCGSEITERMGRKKRWNFWIAFEVLDHIYGVLVNVWQILRKCIVTEFHEAIYVY